MTRRFQNGCSDQNQLLVIARVAYVACWYLVDIADSSDVRFALPKPDRPPSARLTPCGNSEDVEFDPCGPPRRPPAEVAELERSELVQNRPGSPKEVRHASHRNEGARL